MFSDNIKKCIFGGNIRDISAKKAKLHLAISHGHPYQSTPMRNFSKSNIFFCEYFDPKNMIFVEWKQIIFLGDLSDISTKHILC